MLAVAPTQNPGRCGVVCCCEQVSAGCRGIDSASAGSSGQGLQAIKNPKEFNFAWGFSVLVVPETEPNYKPRPPYLLDLSASAVFRCPQRYPQNEKYPLARRGLCPISAQNNQQCRQGDGANPLFCGSKKKAPPVVRESHTAGVLTYPLRCPALGRCCPWLRVRVSVGLDVGASCWSCPRW